MPLVVGALPDIGWEPICEFLQVTGWFDPSQKSVESWYSSDQLSGADSTNSKYLLLHVRPEFLVAKSLETGGDLDTAIRVWKKHSESLLKFLRRNRSNTLLVNVESVLQRPAQFLEVVSKKFQLPPVCKNIGGGFQQRTEADETKLLANQFVLQYEGVSDLILELQACTFPLVENDYSMPNVNVRQVSEAFRNHKEKVAREVSNREKVEEENSLLIRQLHKLQERLERLHSREDELLNELKKVKLTLENKEKSTVEINSAFNKSKQNNKKMQLELDRVKKSVNIFERKFKDSTEKNKTLHRSLTQANKDLVRAKKKIESIRSSTSWRLMGPLRVVKRAFFGKGFLPAKS